MHLNASESGKRRIVKVTGPRHSVDILPVGEFFIEDGELKKLNYTYGRGQDRRQVTLLTITAQDIAEMGEFLTSVSEDLKRWVSETRPEIGCRLLVKNS